MHLRHERSQQGWVRFEHAIGEPLQTSAQDRHRCAQFVRDCGVPMRHGFAGPLQPLGQQIEIVNQHRCFRERLVTRHGARLEIAMADPARTLRH